MKLFNKIEKLNHRMKRYFRYEEDKLFISGISSFFLLILSALAVKHGLPNIVSIIFISFSIMSGIFLEIFLIYWILYLPFVLIGHFINTINDIYNIIYDVIKS